MDKRARSYKDLFVYQNALTAAMEIFEITKTFPNEEKYSLIDQIRRSSRSVCANLAEAWRRRRYEAAFIAKLNDAAGEANETQVWIELATRCRYLDLEKAVSINRLYDHILAQLTSMMNHSNRWVLNKVSPFTPPPSPLGN